jgi:hypothetical protein
MKTKTVERLPQKGARSPESMTADELDEVLLNICSWADQRTSHDVRLIVIAIHNGFLHQINNRFLYPGGEEIVGVFLKEYAESLIKKAKANRKRQTSRIMREAKRTHA